jgi:hypothetical protein
VNNSKTEIGRLGGIYKVSVIVSVIVSVSIIISVIVIVIVIVSGCCDLGGHK